MSFSRNSNNNKYLDFSQGSTWNNKRVCADAEDERKGALSTPEQFIEEICSRRGLVSKTLMGTSALESECIRRAEEARQDFKDKVASVTVRPVGILTDADKYEQRLLNNRKSAAASKVFNEVLKREYSTLLQSLSSAETKQLKRIRALDTERGRLLEQSTELRPVPHEERNEITQRQPGFRDERDRSVGEDPRSAFTAIEEKKHTTQRFSCLEMEAAQNLFELNEPPSSNNDTGSNREVMPLSSFSSFPEEHVSLSDEFADFPYAGRH